MRRLRSWFVNTIARSSWQENTHGSEQEWPRKETPPSKRLPWCISSGIPFRYVGGTLVPYDRAKMPQPLLLHPSWRNHPLWGSQAVQLIHLKLLLPSYLSCQISPLWALHWSLWGTHSLIPLPVLCRKNRTALLVAHLVIITARGLMLVPQR